MHNFSRFISARAHKVLALSLSHYVVLPNTDNHTPTPIDCKDAQALPTSGVMLSKPLLVFYQDVVVMDLQRASQSASRGVNKSLVFGTLKCLLCVSSTANEFCMKGGSFDCSCLYLLCPLYLSIVYRISLSL